MGKVPRGHTTPRARRQRVGPGGSYRDWAELDTAATWAPPARSGQRTDVRTGRPLQELIDGALVKRAGVPFIEIDWDGLEKLAADLPGPQMAAPFWDPEKRQLVPQPAAPSPPVMASSPASLRPPAAPAPSTAPSSARASATDGWLEPPPAPPVSAAPPSRPAAPTPPASGAVPAMGPVPPPEPGQFVRKTQQQLQNQALLDGGFQQMEIPTDRPQGWWEWFSRLLGGWWHQLSGAGTVEDYHAQLAAQDQQWLADNSAQAEEYNQAAVRQMYASGDEIKYDKTNPIYANDAATLQAMAIAPILSGQGIYDAQGNLRPGVDPTGGRTRYSQGAGIRDNLSDAWNWVTGDDAAATRRVGMRNDMTDYEQYMRLHGMRGDEAAYNPDARAGVVAPAAAQWRNGVLQGDDDAARTEWAIMARMSNDVNANVTPENRAQYTGMDIYQGRLLPAQEAMRLNALDHMRNLGYDSLQEMHADGFRLGPGGTLEYPERFREFIGKTLADEADRITNTLGVSGERAIEMARNNLMVTRKMYIPGGDAMAPRQAATSAAAGDLIAQGVPEEEAWARAKQQTNGISYTATSLYDEARGGSKMRAETSVANAQAAQQRRLATGADAKLQRFTADNWGDYAENAASALATGAGDALSLATLGVLNPAKLRDAQLAQQQLRRDTPEMFATTAGDDVNWSSGLNVGRDLATAAYDAAAGTSEEDKRRRAMIQAIAEANPNMALAEGTAPLAYAAQAVAGAPFVWSTLKGIGGGLYGMVRSGYSLGRRAVGLQPLAPSVSKIPTLSQVFRGGLSQPGMPALDAFGGVLGMPTLGAAAANYFLSPARAEARLPAGMDKLLSTELAQKSLEGALNTGDPEQLDRALMWMLPDPAERARVAGEIAASQHAGLDPGTTLRQAAQTYGPAATGNYARAVEQQEQLQLLLADLDAKVQAGELTEEQVAEVLREAGVIQ